MIIPRKHRAAEGFTLVEIMIVVAIIGLLAALAIPQAMHARERAFIETIRSNLRVIEDSKQQWAAFQRVGAEVEPPPDELAPYLKGERLPSPVIGETYNINPVGVVATATLASSLVNLPAGAEVSLE